MPDYRIEYTARAAKQLTKLPRPITRRIMDHVDELTANPRPRGVKKLVGGDAEWRLRVGEYRVIYLIQDDLLLVLVVTIGHRRDLYQRHSS